MAIEPFMQAAYDEVKAAMDATGVITELSVGFVVDNYRHESTPCCKWELAAHRANGKCHTCSGLTLSDALSGLKTLVKNYPSVCPTCGGRMDGPCKHSHE